MQNVNFNKMWITLLSVIWLIGGAPHFEKTPVSEPAAYAEVSISTNSVADDWRSYSVLYFYQEHVDWLSFVLEMPLLEPDFCIPFRFEKGALNTFFSIISYQYFISSLS